MDWKGELYCGIILKRNYDTRTVNLSIPGYVKAQFHNRHHQKLRQPEHSPYFCDRPQYGVKQQLAKKADTSELFSDAENRCTKQVLGSILWYSCSIDPTMHFALRDLAYTQTSGIRYTA